jgi:ElaB/YqjD/DUF883 family membrane-anchored ribosome-binding protein
MDDDEDTPWTNVAVAMAWVMLIFGLVGLLLARVIG